MHSELTIGFTDLMGNQLKEMSLHEILDYHKRYIDSYYKETEKVRAKTLEKLKKRGIDGI